MLKKIYHGSNHIIEKPLFGFGKPYNDYGLGFYCTEQPEMAKEWGVGKGRDGFANAYEIDCEGLRILNLNTSDYSVLHWLAVLLKNRTFELSSPLALEAKEYLLAHFLPDYEAYDVIIGHRADDSYFAFAQDFLNGTISCRQLGNAMRLGKLGEQFVLKSAKAFDRIRFTGYEISLAALWYVRKMDRDLTARREYFDLERNRRQKGDLYILQILDEQIDGGDPRIRSL